MDINIIEIKAKRLFEKINCELNGYRFYTIEETKEDKENFVNAILNENIDYLKEKYGFLQNGNIYRIKLYRECIELMISI